MSNACKQCGKEIDDEQQVCLECQGFSLNDTKYRCPICYGAIEYWGFNGNPFCPKCYKYVKPVILDNKEV